MSSAFEQHDVSGGHNQQNRACQYKKNKNISIHYTSKTDSVISKEGHMILTQHEPYTPYTRLAHLCMFFKMP